MFESENTLRAISNLGAVQTMLLEKTAKAMAHSETLALWVPFIKEMNKRIEELEKKVAELERQAKSSDGGSGTGHYGAGPWG